MGASLGLRQGPKRAQASSAGVVLSLPGRDGNKLLQSHRGCAQGERSSAKGPPTPTPNPVTLESLRASSGCCPSLRRPVDPWAPQDLLLHRLTWCLQFGRAISGQLQSVWESGQCVGITSVPGMVGAGRHWWIRPPQFPSLPG